MRKRRKNVRRFLGIRLVSASGSAERNEPSWLAIFETLLAVALSISLAVWLGTSRFFAISVCVAPLLLLRTNLSKELAVRLFDSFTEFGPGVKFWQVVFDIPVLLHALLSLAATSIFQFIPDITLGRRLGLLVIGPFFFLSLLCLSISSYALLARIVATVFGSLRHPLLTLSNIPSNWFRVTFCVDLCSVPELVPGHEVTLTNWWTAVNRRELETHRAVVAVFWLVPGLAMFLPAVFYRWSLKATALVYMPLIWIAWTTGKQIKSIRREVEGLYQSSIASFVAAWSGFVIVTFAVKWLSLMFLGKFGNWWNDTQVARFLSVYVVPEEIPIWQLASFINAVLAFGLFLLAQQVLAWNVTGKQIFWTIRSTAFVRGVLTLYTVICTAYITLQALPELELPRLGTKLFPWN